MIEKKNNMKLPLKKFTVTKLNNLGAIKGGLGDITDDPIETTKTSRNCPGNGSDLC